MRKWRLPLTYQPKIEPVKEGTCRQTIRVLTVNKKTGKLAPRKAVGDSIRFFLWSGRPYWSKQSNLTEYQPLREVIDILILREGLVLNYDKKYTAFLVHPWNHEKCDEIARLDFISPPTGQTLRDVLIGKNGKIPAEGIEAQILRW